MTDQQLKNNETFLNDLRRVIQDLSNGTDTYTVPNLPADVSSSFVRAHLLATYSSVEAKRRELLARNLIDNSGNLDSEISWTDIYLKILSKLYKFVVEQDQREILQQREKEQQQRKN